MKRLYIHLKIFFIALSLNACASPISVQSYDFGALRPNQNVAQNVTPNTSPIQFTLAEIRVPLSLDGNAMHYRLAYNNTQELRPYANSRWGISPAQLLETAIKQQLTEAGAVIVNSSDGVKDIPILKIELEKFEQIFSSVDSSEVQVQFRASLIHQNHLLGQKNFRQNYRCTSADAKGGAQAMPLAIEAMLMELNTWLRLQVDKHKVH
ncbi:MAG: ABC-type transport auxiliary lipoprotein family protein [Undibacterium sp.]|nr:ABC-type transport auxiliary lipoprotein family protein [Undibacterium sp.]